MKYIVLGFLARDYFTDELDLGSGLFTVSSILTFRTKTII